MPGYLTITELKASSTMPDEEIDALNTRYASFLDAQLENVSAWIDGRLRKRYAAPFAAPVPAIVKLWASAMVTELAYLKRGVEPTDAEMARIFEAAKEARAEIDEAANGETGRFDLPLRADTTTTGVSKGGTRAYSEASPYVGFTRQGVTGRTEDSNGRGSSS